MTISTRQSVELILRSTHTVLVACPIFGDASDGQAVDMLWSRPINKGESG